MAKNKVQFQAGYSLFEFIKDYGTEEQCHQALYKWRWPTGFVCPDCGSKKHSTLISMLSMSSPNISDEPDYF